MTALPAPAPESDGYLPAEFVYKGVRLDSKNKKTAAFAELVQSNDGASFDDRQNTERWFDFNPIKKALPAGLRSFSPGVILRIPCKKGEGRTMSVRFTSAEYVGKWDNQDDRIAWAALERGALTQLDFDAAIKKAVSVDALEEALAPIRAAYQKAGSTARRRAILAAVLQHITG